MMNKWKQSDKFAHAAVLLLADNKLLAVANMAEAERLLTDLLKPDYIPHNALGCAGEDNFINPRPCPPYERCAQEVGDDIQSGPIYCGDPAAVLADVKDKPEAYAAPCRSCWLRHGFKLPEGVA